MSRAAQGTVLAVAVLAVGGMAWWLLGGGGPGAGPGDRAPAPGPDRGDGAGARPAAPGERPPEVPSGVPDPEPPSGIVLRGRVVDRAGKPVAGAAVEARPPIEPWTLDLRGLGESLFEDAPPRARGTSGADGTFALRGLPAGSWTVSATAAGHAPAREEGVVLQAAETPPVVLVLGPGFEMLVRVLDSGGAPVSGAEVVAARMGGAGWIPVGGALARASTDSAGQARLQGLGEGRPFVVARAGPGRVAGRPVQVPDDREIEIRLGGTAALVVRVDAVGGGPVEGAVVTAVLVLQEGPAGILVSGTSGPDGMARFDGLAPGTVTRLCAEKAGFAPSVLGGPQAGPRRVEESMTLQENATIEVVIRLRPGAVLAGTVRLQPSGTPVPRARISLFDPEFLALGLRRTSVSDDAGVYRLEDLPGGRAVVFAHADGAATPGALPGGIEPQVLMGRGGPSPLTVEILEGPAETRHDISVEATGSVAGRVLGPDGAPAPGARVSVRGRNRGGDVTEPGEDLPPAAVLSGADGTFRVERVPAGEGMIAVASLAGRVPGVSDSFGLEAGGGVEGLQVSLATGGILLGRVTGPDGGPVPGAAVRFATRADRWRAGAAVRLADEGARDATTGADGTFRIEACPSGGASVTVAAEGYVRRTLGDVQVADGIETRADVALEAGREIHGRVLDAAAVPVAGARVGARNNDRRPPSGIRTGSATTGRDGTFRIGGLPPGSWTVSVSSPDHPPAFQSPVESGGSALEIRLPAPVRISGRVIDASGNPLQGIRVDAQAGTPGTPGGGATSLPDGSFEIRNLVAVTYRLHAQSSTRHAAAIVEGVEGGTKGVEIRLVRAFSIAGRVVDPNGGPAAGRGRVRVLDVDGTQVSSTRWDGKGEFEVRGLTEGSYTLQVRVDGPPALVATASARAGAEGVVLRLHPE